MHKIIYKNVNTHKMEMARSSEAKCYLIHIYHIRRPTDENDDDEPKATETERESEKENKRGRTENGY